MRPTVLGLLAGVALAAPVVQENRPVPQPAYPPVYRRPVLSNHTNSTVPSNKTALVTDDISSCSTTWMAIPDVTIGAGTDRRRGFTSAVNSFCDMASGRTVASQDYLSMATEVFLNGGMNPSSYGLLGYVYFEIHNKLSSAHTVDAASCKKYLGTLSAAGGQCYGTTNGDTKGGTYQVGTNGVSYHALGNTVPPTQDALNKLLQTTVLAAQSVNKGSGAPLNPWPLDSLNSVLPTSCHSHNDYDNSIPAFGALSAGCIGMEADVWLFQGDVILGHILPTIGRTLRAQYVNPLKAIIDHNGGSVYKSRPDQTLVLLIDFKTSDTGTLDAVVKALDPLRQAGYLSRLEGGVPVRKAVTVVASGSAPFDRISTGDGVPNRDIFYDANLGALGGTTYTAQNSYVASADFQDVVGEAKTASLTTAQMNIITNHVNQAHAKGLVARYWNLPGEYLWEPLEALGVDLLNADNLPNTARIPRL
ncbi:putative altered inheritance of mitochondria protein 6 [Rosellinia necatrix]|uniref:Putative altered inheritance of mitochondria protein 6 n=1 Tax=Rosellinia necatrix TaxID=77044 RepID=A0A1W2THU9_ROSNE|nr:putative altered inheritance of mitochondria protein 6 [Rosellinia necatrix]